MNLPILTSRWRILIVGILALSLALALRPTEPSQAATTITVTTPQDSLASDGLCSLREAIIAANTDRAGSAVAGECPAGNGADLIIVPAGTYLLDRTNSSGSEDATATGDLDITGSVVISSTGPVTITVTPNFADRIFHILAGDVTLAGLTIANADFSGDGAAIYNQGSLTLRDTTLSGSRSGGDGGGIYNSSTLTLTNVTLSGNRANRSGGGLFQAAGSARLNNVTLSGNVADANNNGIGNGGGLFVASGNLQLGNSLLAGNVDGPLGATHRDCSGSVASLGYNLVQNPAGCLLLGGRGDLTSIDPLLGALQNNGGNTPTHALLAGSPAIDAANPAPPGSSGACEVTDQRGALRPRGLACDIGAFEAGTANPPVLIRAVAGGGGTTVDGRLFGPPATDFTLDFVSSTTCDAAGPGSNLTAIGQDLIVTEPSGSTYFQSSLAAAVQAGRFVAARAIGPDGSASPYSACVVAGAGNDSWPNALQLNLAGEPLTAEVDGVLDSPGQSRWYRFTVQPNSRVIVRLTNLPANYDLTLYKDIRATLDALTLGGQADLDRLGAEFAPDAFSPDAFSPDAFSPDAFSPDAFSPDAFSPDAFSPDAFSPDAFSPDAFSPDAFSPDAFSPDAFSPDAFSPDAFSPDAFSPDAFSPDAFSSAQVRSLIAVSAFEGTAGEGISVNTWNNSGHFYVRVRGRNGAFHPAQAFHLDVTLLAGGCSGLVPEALPPGSLAGAAGNFRSIILTDPGRMGSSPALAQALAELAARPEVAGVVVNVGADARVAAANALSDAAPGCPPAKNLVAHAIRDIVDRYREHNPLEYVVLVGNDDVIPFFRHPDQALLANEKNYSPPVRDNTASQASLKLSYVLSQDRYGALFDISLKGNTLPIPAMAVGRLVETETDVLSMLAAYAATNGGVVPTPATALVTGYDFFDDAAHAIGDELAAGLGQPVSRLISPRDLSPQHPDAWTADQWREALLTSRQDLAFLGGHFSASSALAADYTTRLLPTDVLEAPIDLRNAIYFSLGCHSGYNIVNPHGVPGVTREPDWAQAFAARGATLIGGTGYQYGDTDFIEYNERLYLEFSRQLRAGHGPVALGQALVAAKVIYLESTAQMRPIHEKALLQVTLFGLPMLSVDLPAGRGDVPPTGSVVGSTNAFNTNPGAALGLTYADLPVVPSLTENSRVLTDISGGSDVVATYLAGAQGVVSNPAEPVLPLELRNVSVPGTTLRGVGFRGGQYTDLPDRLPLVGVATTEIRGVHTPFLSDVLFPVRPWGINYFGALAGSGRGTQLVVLPAQVRSTAPGLSSATVRRLDSLDFRLFYSADTATYGGGSTPALAAPPSIVQVASQLTEGKVRFSLRVTGNPAAGIQAVWVTFTAEHGPFAGRWQSLDLTQHPLDSTLWQGELDSQGTPADSLRFMAQAVNGVGLVALDANQGAYHAVGGAAEPTVPTQLAFVDAPASGSYGSQAVFSAVLTSDGAPLAGKVVVFGLGPQSRVGVSDQAGRATAVLSLLGVPGPHVVNVSFAGSGPYLPASASAAFEIARQSTQISLVPSAVAIMPGAESNIVATLTTSAGRPLSEKSVFFILTGPGGSYQLAEITDYLGRASLGRVALPPGDYALAVYFSGAIPLPGGTLTLDDERYTPASAQGTVTILTPTNLPDCSGAVPSASAIWPPNGRFATVNILGIQGSGDGSVAIVIDAIRQDERVGSQPDGRGIGTSTAEVRVERDGNGDGRVYHIYFTATDSSGASCSGVVRVGIAAHDQSGAADLDAIDGGPLYDSTVPD
jgi:CSLREA domain-containing protein